MFKNMGGNIPGENFPGGSLLGGSFPDTQITYVCEECNNF